jgi:hypothetical protein
VEEREVKAMCQEKSSCSHPENSKEEPRECSAEQIAICHPDGESHSCEAKESEKSEHII